MSAFLPSGRIPENASVSSTHDVGRLAKMIHVLKDTNEHQIGRPIDRVLVASPSFSWPCNRDLIEAVEYYGLVTFGERFGRQPHNLSAAYAGYGFGLCENYTNVEVCTSGEELLFQQTLSLSFSNSMRLHAHIP